MNTWGWPQWSMISDEFETSIEHKMIQPLSVITHETDKAYLMREREGYEKGVRWSEMITQLREGFNLDLVGGWVWKSPFSRFKKNKK